MKFRLVFMLVGIFMSAQSIAGVGDIDNREYADWSQYPSILLLRSYLSLHSDGYIYCTGQYVAPDLILTAAHCVTNSSGGINKKFEAQNYRGDIFDLQLAETTNFRNTYDDFNDWALLRVTDSKYYSDSFYELDAPNKAVQVYNAGFGWVRILSNDEIALLRQEYDKIIANTAIYPDGKRYIDTENAKLAFDNILTKPLRDKEDSLKIDKSCTILYDENCFDLCYENQSTCQSICGEKTNSFKSKFFPNILMSTCDIWAGNSGGPYIDRRTNKLVSICSYGGSELYEFRFNNQFEYNGTVSSRQFSSALNNLKKSSPTIKPKEQQPNNTDEQTNTNATTPDSEIDNALQQIDTDIQKTTDDFNRIVNMGKNITDSQFLHGIVENIVTLQQLQELRSNATAMKEKEQSDANRMLGGASMGATGIGAMMAASAYSEQRADA
ncbi:MAG: trypsin-like serine protease, partial [Alphaproteobacteria bacterium]|nr:trypsin-like serine protease [Alphaproteobacteria bacterium]